MPIPGIPPLLNQASQAVANVGLLVADAAGIANLFSGSGPSWGVFLKGKAVVVPDSVISLEYKQDWQIVNYPMEKGAFESYNKVTTPFYTSVRMSKGGTVLAKQAFLAAIESLANSFDLYDVVTPEKTYTSVSVSHVDYDRRARKGLGLLTVDLWLTQVRVTVQAGGPSTVAPSGADPINLGTVQPQSPLAAQLAGVQSSIVGPITNTLSTAIVNATPALSGALSGLDSTISSTLASATSNITPALESAMTNVQSVISSASPAITGEISSAMSTMSAQIADVATSLPQVTTAMQSIGQSLQGSLNFNLVLGGH